ncbi:MAG: VirB3 family type IV secretion system protein [Pseudomonadota bacterium]
MPALLLASPIYKAITRTPSLYGVAYDYAVMEMMIAGLAFIIHLPYVLVIIPLHAIGLVAFKIDPQFFSVLRVTVKFCGRGNSSHKGGRSYDAS